MKKQELYVSVDIEADGPVPGVHSMLSFGAAVFDINKNLYGTFERNLNLLLNSVQHQDTMNFWNRSEENKKAYADTRINTVDPLLAMKEFEVFLLSLPGTPIFIGYPAMYDFKWIDYYFYAFCGSNPFGFSRVIDVKSYAWALLGKNFLDCTKRHMPKDWFDDLPHTHRSLDDALEQGALSINIIRFAQKLPPIKNINRKEVI